MVEQELGVEVPVAYYGGRLWGQFFAGAHLRDVLDVITLVWRDLVRKGYERRATSWRQTMSQVIAEEGLGFLVNEHGAVRRVVDAQFEQVRRGVLAALDAERYTNARDCFEEAHRQLAGVQPHRKAGVRSMFECIKALVRMLIGGQRLNSKSVHSGLVPLLEHHFAPDQTAERAITRISESLCE